MRLWRLMTTVSRPYLRRKRNKIILMVAAGDATSEIPDWQEPIKCEHAHKGRKALPAERKDAKHQTEKTKETGARP